MIGVIDLLALVPVLRELSSAQDSQRLQAAADRFFAVIDPDHVQKDPLAAIQEIVSAIAALRAAVAATGLVSSVEIRAKN